MDRSALYKQLYSIYEKAHQSKPKRQVQQEVNEIWNKAKSNPNTLEKTVTEAIDSATSKLSRQKATLSMFWATAQTLKPKVQECAPQAQSSTVESAAKEKPTTPPAEPSTSSSLPAKRPAPAQERMKIQLADINQELLLLHGRKERGLLTDDDGKRMYKLKMEKQAVEHELKKKIGDQSRSQKRRDDLKQSLKELTEKIPEATKILNMQPSAGRPRVEDKQPELLKSIIDIALYGSAAHDRRQDESYRSVRTLSAIRMLEELSSLLGPREVFVVSQDDKARVPLGLTAANKQSPMVMHVEYKVSIPDHDFVVAKQHKLIPSVYAAVAIKPDAMGKPEAVGYTGPTYIAIRSAKHSSSTALSHGLDYTRLLEHPDFEGFSRHDGEVKPVHVIFSDGGPDENPRYQKVIKVAIHHFVSHDLDALFLATNAPGRSAYNRVERRMAPLSKQLSGLILEHEFYGSHLDSQMRTIDPELERKNFGHAGQTLASVWSEVRFDDYPVLAEYIEPDHAEMADLIEKDADWFAAHVRSSQYLLQLVKCTNQKCCKSFRSSLLTVLPNRFLPPPLPLYQTDFGLKVPNPSAAGNKNFASLFVISSMDLSKIMPNSIQSEHVAFDSYCPTVFKRIKERTCKKCNLYFASNVLQKEHSKIHKAPASDRKIRPKRIVGKRGHEVLVITPEDDREWVEAADIADAIIPAEQTMEEICPTISLESRMEIIWTDATD